MFAIAEQNITIREALFWAENYLNKHKVSDAKTEAEYLLSHVLNCKRSGLYINSHQVIDSFNLQIFRNYIERRIKREPSQYIIGEQEFWGLVFKVTKDVLIPRPETELLVEEVIKTGGRGQRAGGSKNSKNNSPLILDLCTGSGCIAVSLAKAILDCKVYATDISDKALNVAIENTKRHGIADRITFLKGDLFEPLKGFEHTFDIIVSNPPYISKDAMQKIEPEIYQYEPAEALYGGDDGMDFYRRIIAESPAYLTKSGYLILEMGYGQAEEIKKLIEQNIFFEHIDIKKDLEGIDRVFKAQRKN